jgi:hypothetical protein
MISGAVAARLSVPKTVASSGTLYQHAMRHHATQDAFPAIAALRDRLVRELADIGTAPTPNTVRLADDLLAPSAPHLLTRPSEIPRHPTNQRLPVRPQRRPVHRRDLLAIRWALQGVRSIDVALEPSANVRTHGDA